MTKLTSDHRLRAFYAVERRCNIRRAQRMALAGNDGYRTDGNSAAIALQRARVYFDAGHKTYDSGRIWKCSPHAGKPFDGKRWIEDPQSVGLRFVDYADEVHDGIRHTGWYCDEYQDEKARGVVYQLPAKSGRARFMAGVADPYNDGPALLSWCDVFEAEPCTYRSHDGMRYTTDGVDEAKREAALCADSMAEAYAEREREWHDADHAGQEARRMMQDAAEACAAFTKKMRTLRAVFCARHDVRRRTGKTLTEMRSLVSDLTCDVRDAYDEWQNKRALALEYIAQNEPRSENLRQSFWDGYGSI